MMTVPTEASRNAQEEQPSPESCETSKEHPGICTIRSALETLTALASFRGNLSKHTICKVINDAADGLNHAQQADAKTQAQADRLYKQVHPLALQACHALLILMLTELDNTDSGNLGNGDPRHHAQRIADVNRCLSDAVFANACLNAGENVLPFSCDQFWKRIATHMRTVRTHNPRHQFPDDIDTAHFLKSDAEL